MKCPNCGSDVEAGEAACGLCFFVLPRSKEADAEAEPVECAKCGTLNPAASASCAMCGVNLAPPAQAAAAKPAEEADEIPAAKPAEAPMQTAVPEDKPSPEPAPASETGGEVVCPSCEYVNPPGAETCEMCNFIMSMTPTKLAKPADAAAEAEKAVADLKIEDAVIHEPPKPKPPPPEPEPKPEKRRPRTPPPDQVIPMGRFPQKIKLSRMMKSRTVTCPNCQAENERDASFCTMCQYVLEPVAERPKVRETPEEAPPPKPVERPAPVAVRPVEPIRVELEPVSEPTPAPEPARPTIEIERFPESRMEASVPEPEPEPEPETEEIQEAPAPEPPGTPGPAGPTPEAAGSGKGRPAAARPPAARKPRRAKSARPFILIVDGDYVNRDALTQFLESRGVKWVADCSNPEEGLIQAQALNVELVLLDMNLSCAGKGGGALKKMRESPFLDKELPVIFMNGLSEEEAAGIYPGGDPCVAIVAKPVDKEALWATIRTLTGDIFTAA